LSDQPEPTQTEQHISIPGLGNQDGRMEITLEEQALIARADFYPPVGEGKPLDPEYIGMALARVGIMYGIDQDTIQTQAMECTIIKKLSDQ
jgi:hypothetical protein